MIHNFRFINCYCAEENNEDQVHVISFGVVWADWPDVSFWNPFSSHNVCPLHRQIRFVFSITPADRAIIPHPILPGRRWYKEESLVTASWFVVLSRGWLPFTGIAVHFGIGAWSATEIVCLGRHGQWTSNHVLYFYVFVYDSKGGCTALIRHDIAQISQVLLIRFE